MQYTDEPRDVLAQYSTLVSVQVPVDSTGSFEKVQVPVIDDYQLRDCVEQDYVLFVLTGRVDASRRWGFCHVSDIS